MSENSTPQCIVIAGGGFAGTTLPRKLDGRLPAGWELVLISEESYTTSTRCSPRLSARRSFPSRPWRRSA